MPLTTRDRTQIYTRLAPMIGEKEAEILLDQFPSTADAQYVTVADLKSEVARLDHRIDLLDAKLSGRMDALEKSVEAMIQKAMRRQMAWTIITMVAVLTLADRFNVFG